TPGIECSVAMPGRAMQQDASWRVVLVCWFTMDPLLARITIDVSICHGKPCIRGLRYPVEMLLELLSSRMTTDEILADYEDLEREDILAALAFAARLSQIKRIEPALDEVSR